MAGVRIDDWLGADDRIGQSMASTGADTEAMSAEAGGKQEAGMLVTSPIAGAPSGVLSI